MRTREFDINNYSLDNIMGTMAKTELKEHMESFKTKGFITSDKEVKDFLSYYMYSSDTVFAKASKAIQKQVIAEARRQYKAKKAKTIVDYKAMRKKCDEVFYDDNMYKKLTPELENLYYCQAHTALEDFMDKKRHSKAVSNSRFQARLMAYSTVSCD